jgi:hypothetical protein
LIVKRIIDREVVLVECAPEFEAAAADVLETLAGLSGSGKPLRDGLRVRFGWSLLTLRTDAEGLRVCEPSFGQDEGADLDPKLNTTLAVLTEQVKWLRRLRVDGTDAYFDQNIIMTESALSAVDIFALRGEATTEADSGWSVAPVPAAGGEVDTSALRAVSIGSLVVVRPGLLPIITLPVGFLVRLNDNRVTEMTSPNGAVVWPLDRSHVEPN